MDQEQDKFDFNAYAKLSTPEEKYRMLDNQYKEAEYLVLSDPMMYRSSGGNEVLMYIQECAKGGALNPSTKRRDNTLPCTWKLKLLKHTDGSDPKPGDQIEWVTQRTNKVFGKKIGTTEAKEFVRRGDADRLTQKSVAVLDKDCCFVVGYTDATQLLNNNGIYFRTGYPISNLPEHFRRGSYHNWRFIEVTPWSDPKDNTPWQPKARKKPGPKPKGVYSPDNEGINENRNNTEMS